MYAIRSYYGIIRNNMDSLCELFEMIIKEEKEIFDGMKEIIRI